MLEPLSLQEFLRGMLLEVGTENLFGYLEEISVAGHDIVYVKKIPISLLNRE